MIINGNFKMNSFDWIGHKECVEILIQNGADIDSKDSDDETALQAATFKGLKQTVLNNFCIETKKNLISCHTYLGHDEVVNVLIKNGADVAAKGKDGKTLLHLASENGRSKNNYICTFHNISMIKKQPFSIIQLIHSTASF